MRYALAVIVIFVLFTESVFAAPWVYTQNFDGLSTGNLGGQDSYTLAAGTVTVTTAQANSAPNSVLFATNATNYVKRSITAVTDDNSIMYFKVYSSSVASADGFRIYMWGNGDGVDRIGDFEIGALAAGNWYLRNSAGTRTLQGTVTASTWNKFAIEFDWTSDRFRASINCGAMGSWVSFGAARSQLNYIWISGENDDGGGPINHYLDDISATSDCGGGGGTVPQDFIMFFGVLIPGLLPRQGGTINGMKTHSEMMASYYRRHNVPDAEPKRDWTDILVFIVCLPLIIVLYPFIK